MTPEDRADKAINELSAREPVPPLARMEMKEIVTSAIREAEDAALERAAGKVEKALPRLQGVRSRGSRGLAGLVGLAARIRALKSVPQTAEDKPE